VVVAEFARIPSSVPRNAGEFRNDYPNTALEVWAYVVLAYRRNCCASASLALLAQAPAADRQRELLYRSPAPRVGVGDGLRECALPKPAGMLFPANGDVHDPGQHLHAAMWLLLGTEGDAGAVGRR